MLSRPETKSADHRSEPFSRTLKVLAAAFVILAVIVAVAGYLAYKQTNDQEWVRHTANVQARLSHVLVLLLDSETGERGYLVTGDENYLEPYNRAAPNVISEIESIRKLTGDNPSQQTAIATLRDAVTQRLDELRALIELRRAGQTEQVLARLRTDAGKVAMDRAREIVGQMQAEESRLSEERKSAAVWSDHALQAGIGAAAVVVMILGFLGFTEARRSHFAMVTANRRLVEEAAERERLAEQLRQSQKMEAVGQLTGGLAHDFNNMLTVIMGSLNLLRRRMERGETNVSQFIDGALDGAQRAATLTSRLLAFARQHPHSPQAIDANKLVFEMSELLRRTAGDDIRFETILAGGLWRTKADSSQLENAILNLVVNARDAMPDGGKLTIETANAHLDDRYAADHVDVPPGQYVYIAVTDTGTGMSAQTIVKAFDPFFTTKDGKGTGLGLSQVYGFARQSGGHAKIYSELGHGTTVKLYLPRFTGAMKEAPVAGKEQERTIPRGSAHETLLVVEDDEHVRRLTVQSARDLGYSVLHAPGAADALRVLEARPEVVMLFTDIVMPDMNGRVLADEALRRRPDLKVLFTTGFTRNAIIHNGILDADVNFIAKPFSLEEFASKIRSVLEN
ncbi:CHASE3 domain-containing protein [Reyranella sp.]|uniref:CHASE3 domain-containing protein n=1 Tax=Reyranella sp. TaxID=1929291 RepID=UPI00378491C3